jgi:hypothetical protein
MNPPRPEDLEKFIHRTLRALPPRSAPPTLELKVMTEIVRRKTQRPRRFGWADGASTLRIALVILSIGAGVGLCALFWVPWSQSAHSWLPAEFGARIERIALLGGSVIDAFGAVFRSIPTLWFYGALAAIALLYSALFGLGASAYRVLASQRE